MRVHRGGGGHADQRGGDRRHEVVLVLDDYHVHRDAPRSTSSVAFLLDHLPPQLRLVIATPCRPAAAARLACGRRASCSRCGPPTCASPPRKPASYLNDAMGLSLDRRGRRRARSPNRGVDRRPPAGRAVDAGPRRSRPRSSPSSPATTGSSSTTSPTRCSSARPPRCRTSCSTPRSWTGSPARSAHAVTGDARREGDARAARPIQPVPRRRSTIADAGTATTTSSPTCSAARLLDEDPERVARAAPAGERLVRANDDPPEPIAHALAGHRLEPARRS